MSEASPAKGPVSHKSAFSRIEDDLRRGLALVPFGGAALAVVAGDQTHIIVLGNAAEGKPVTPSTPFHICSCSKMFTAALVSQLVSDGALSWEAPVRSVVPEFEFSDPWVTEYCTFRDLAAMRVGLTGAGIAEWGFRQDAQKAKRLERARHMVFAAPFRERFSYSNLCYIALTLAAERIANEPYPELLHRLICAPLNLQDTWSGGFGAAPRREPARPYLPIAEELTPVAELTGPNSEGSARIHLSARDATLWMQFLVAALGGSETGPLSSAAVAQMASPQSIVRDPDIGQSPEGGWSAYGFGLFATEFLGKPLLRHGGGGRGWRHAMALAPADGVGVMLMVSAEAAGIDGLALEILERLLCGQARDWRVRFAETTRVAAEADRRSAEELFAGDGDKPASIESHEGIYGNPVTGQVRLKNQSGQMCFLPVDAPIFAASLQPLGNNVHDLAFDDPALSPQPLDPLFRVRFRADRSGKAIDTGYFGELRGMP